MFLKSLDIYGFKSFADRTHIDFSSGITALLGPNGCGKSNIVDSIKWVLGEQSTKTLRASRMDDVIFNGTDKRKPMDYAEVTLTIDNSEHHLPTDITEVEIKRRVFRSGESEYYLNRHRCLLKNIKELFFDTGVGKSAYSVLEQGKIDQILSSKPEDRRYIFEEAAGISRFKVECNQAKSKLERTDENIAQVEITVNEVKRTYDRTKKQAEKVRESKELDRRIFELDVELQVSKIKTLMLAKEDRTLRMQQAEAEKERLRKLMEDYSLSIGEEQDMMRERNEEFNSIRMEMASIETSIKGIDSLIDMLTTRFQEFAMNEREANDRAGSIRDSIERLRDEKENLSESLLDKSDLLEEKEKQIQYARSVLELSQRNIEKAEAEIALKEERNADLDQELLKLSEELKGVIESLIEEVDSKTGDEYSSDRKDRAEKALLGKAGEIRRIIDSRISFLSSLSPDMPVSRDVTLKEYTRLGNEIDSFASLLSEYKASIPPVVDTLLSPEGLMSRKRSIGKREDEARAELEANRRSISDNRERISALRADVDGYNTTISQLIENAASIRADVESTKRIMENIQHSMDEKGFDLEDALSAAQVAHQRMLDTNASLKEKDEKKRMELERRDELNQRSESLRNEIADQNKALMSKIKEKDQAFSQYNSAINEASNMKMYIESIDNSIGEVFSAFFTRYARNLNEFDSYLEKELPDSRLLENEIAELQKQKAGLGNINYMAEDDFNEAKDQYEFYSKQLDDLYKAKSDLEKVLGDIEEESRQLFLKTYKAISENFQAMFRRIFGGGKAEIRLTDPDDVLNSGIDIIAQPPGKNPAHLTLLSGGERSMTAVALLFATYQEKPSPFCILDEIDAALDDRNVGNFLDILTDFGRSSQFIIITHNKHTVTGASTLLGVTQQEAGVSIVVGYRIDRIEGKAVITNEEGSEVDFDAEGRLNV
ncbi:MAG: AAA family ATPase [Candidatus Ornithospirochaeta sp.]|nr:AAA family ATPase [Candidatus Ornithospirochaeta sp.]